jgi:hypothetical protein
MDLNPYKRIRLVECGALMADHTGSLVGNACFFTSLRAGLEEIGHPLAGINYSDFLALGGWSRSFKGRMVDTYPHAANIECLALALGVKIGVYTEIIPGMTNSTIYAPFGGMGVQIRIIRLHGFSHFNLMKWSEIQNVTSEECRQAEEAEAHRRFVLEVQSAADTDYVLAFAEEEQVLEAARATRVAADAVYASAMAEKWTEEDTKMRKQVDEDAALARRMQETEESALVAAFEQL